VTVNKIVNYFTTGFKPSATMGFFSDST